MSNLFHMQEFQFIGDAGLKNNRWYMIKLKETPDPKTRIELFRQTCNRSVKEHKLNYIFLPSEFDSVKKYLDDVDCLMVGIVSDPLSPLSVCGVAS